MTTKKLSTAELLRRVDAGDSYADIGKDHGISRQAVYNRVKKLRGKTTRAVVAAKVEKVVDRKIDAIENLKNINEHANWLLEHVMKWIKGDETAIQVLEKNTRLVNVGTKEDPEYVTEYKFKDPHEIALKAMAAIRSDIKLQFEMFQALYSLKAAEEFQNTVLEVIGEVDPSVRNEIIRRLNKRRVTESAVRFT